MITVLFEGNKGFEISGHSGYSEIGSDIVCASVSSAAYMVANTLTEIVKAEADIKVDDGYMKLRVLTDSRETDILMEGFRLHITQLALQYPQYVITKTENKE